VFRTAALQAQQWRARYGADFQVSINKSPVQFHSDKKTHGQWIDFLKELGLDGGSIVIEITEGLLLNAERQVIEKLLEFCDAGVQVAIDDFGTGYSSLAYLKKFSIDYLKIDQSFTRNLARDSEDMAPCEAVVIMAHKLGLKVIAEGVENQPQHDLLRKIGCDYAQGYLFSEPQRPEDLEQLLRKSGRDCLKSFSL
jgi:EAL domain-containing protein (putative c-di-GMP-specific phosphodiesterase class I)